MKGLSALFWILQLSFLSKAQHLIPSPGDLIQPLDDTIVLINSGSTNTWGFILTINSDGSGEYNQTKKWAPGTFDYKLLLKAIKADTNFTSEIRNCYKSISSGSTETIRYNGKTSGDISCPIGAKEEYLLRLVNTILSVAHASEEMKSHDDTVYSQFNRRPQFPGGDDAMRKFTQQNIIYPAKKIEIGVSGRIYVNFTIGEEGDINDIKVLRGITGHPEFDTVAIDLVKKMPKWAPGKQNGKPVKVSYNIFIDFKHI